MASDPKALQHIVSPGRDTPVGRGLGRSAPADPVFSQSHSLTVPQSHILTFSPIIVYRYSGGYALEEQRFSLLAYLKRTEPAKYQVVLEQCFTPKELRILANDKWRKYLP